MAGYQSPVDLHRIPDLLALAPVEGRAFMAFDHAARRADGLLPPRVRELVALAVALTTQCAYCIDVHARVTREELAELVAIAAAVRAGASMAHGLLALRLFDAVPPPG